MHGYRISTDKSLLDLELIHAYLGRDSYWAVGRSMEIVRRSIGTRDAHGLYSRYGGFTPLSTPDRWMERVPEKT
jgi:hypothetical protein